MKKLILCILVLFSIHTAAQSTCDSLSYEIQPGQILNIISINNSATAVTFVWMACDSDFCFSDMGDTVSFPQVNISDTIKICYDAFPCYYCDSLVFTDGLWTTIRNVTSIYEITGKYNNGKIYDVLGRELKYVPTSTIYIRNGRLYK